MIDFSRGLVIYYTRAQRRFFQHIFTFPAIIGWDLTSLIALFWLAIANPLSLDSSMAELLAYDPLLALTALPNFHPIIFP